ncbi:putative lipid II flippase FtsW [Desulfovibrio legallii]|uniref:Probable peptidoglycan glycosyltransferase FtsW n=3 Tax=Desulfovibrio legallii TaxID=571438 RepID=A0A6H3FBN8_9BACT|nr:putative lipid II flippase FtsW [Desulfovibrio legallii]RHH26279.1 putative lipid II flippase FtsW [Desulfovibrio sp. AM18-2]TBH81786.1 putative lipid II flippase FtsW [Desulfovibrio legallii]CAI3226169.1 Peptidoglycan glycosyltransferase FtsW (EC [Desulfovibrio diazotrophicus]VVU43002.1 Peptidoglycan glycosyltransferase FtsW (EC [Desulfovibrio diazotrophicus]
MKNVFTAKTVKKSGESPLARAMNGATNAAPFDWWLFALMLVILAIGLVMVLSASGIVAEQVNGDKYYFFKRQIFFALAGGAALWGAALMPRQWLYHLQYPALFVALLLLLVTLSPLTPAINGAKRWIPLGPVSVQPMEFVKIALALYLAYFMSSKQDLIKTFSRGVIPPFAVTGLFCFLLLLQPDFGSAVVLACLLFFMCVAGGTRFIYLFFSVALACAGAMALAISSPYRLRRLLAFLDPFQDAHNTGYQLVQSLLAIGSGSFFGVGVGASKQKMFYLPEAHNDFIMAVLAEELGFVGVSVVMILFALLFWRCYKIIMGQQNLRDRFTAFGITTILVMGAVLNLAVVMGVAPPKGVPMPLMSYGGSNLVATMLCVGLLMNFSRTAEPWTASS